MSHKSVSATIDDFANLPDRWGVHFYGERSDGAAFYSYPTLHALVLNHAQKFRACGIGPATRVILPFETSMQAVVSFLALLWEGALVLCVKPPASSAGAGAYAEFIGGISGRHRADFILDVSTVEHAKISLARLSLPTLDPSAPAPAAARGDESRPDDVVFVQFSSGSTSFPKGVPITNRNLLIQLDLLTAFDRRVPGERGANWLPLFHDMGLIGGFLSALYAGLELYLWSPRRFLSDPLGWLEALSASRIRGFAMPNFAIEYILRTIQSGNDRMWTDLRFDALEHVYVGAEPINPSAFAELARFLGKRGMRPGVMQPAYGMAEAVLIATGGRDAPPRVALAPNGVPCISVGRPLPGFELRVHVEGCDDVPSGEGRVGAIRLRGGSMASEYFEHETPLLDNEGYYRTGDIGFVRDGELFVLGRDGERIKVNGETFFAHDFERVVESLPAIRSRSCVVLQHRGQIHVLLERLRTTDFDKIGRAVSDRVFDAFGLKITESNVVPLCAGQILRTSSGKLQRLAMVDAFASGRLRRLDAALPEASRT